MNKKTMRPAGIAGACLPVFFLALAMPGLWITGCKNKKEGKNTVSLVKRTITDEVVFSARVMPFNAAAAEAGVTGTVVSVKKIPGSHVTSGDVIALIRDRSGITHNVSAASEGTLLAVNFSEGESTEANQVFYVLGNNEKKLVIGELNDLDAAQLAPGQKCMVPVGDSVMLEGNIDYVNQVGTETNGNIKFKVAGRVNDPRNLVKFYGISLPVKVLLRQVENAGSVEKTALITRGSKHFLRVKQDGKIIEREVETGVENDIYVQILKGINENEQIVLPE